MKSSKNNIIFTVNPALEFIYGLNFAGNKETMYKFFADFNFTPAEEFKQTIEEMKSKLSRYIQGELRFFFQWEPIKNVLGRIVEENENIASVLSFIDFIEQMDENKLLSYIAVQAIYGVNAPNATNDWNKDGDIVSNIIDIISNIDEDSPIDKEKLLECAENPLEIKSRLVLLMKQFYKKSYKQYEAYILSELDKAKKRYEKLYNNKLDYFTDEYLRSFSANSHRKLIIHIGYFYQIRVWTFDIKSYNDAQWITLGIHSEHYPRKEYIKAKVQNLIKILSDKKRFEMIELLSKRPHYVHELSSELELTSPTVCYHLNYMLDLNLVSMSRENSKTYYSLNKDMIKELLDNTETILLK